MQTIRGRLTVWYSAALVLTLAAFAIVLYVARRRASYDDLDQRIRSEAELSAAILGESYRARGALRRPRAPRAGRAGAPRCGADRERRRPALRVAARRRRRAHRGAGGRPAAFHARAHRPDRTDRSHSRRLLDRAPRARAGGPDHQ